MKLPVLTLLSFCACACWASPQPGAPANFGIVRFASPDGSPTNDGLTPATPLSVGAALAQANASMIIKLLPGTYPSIEITRPGTRLVSQPKWAAVVVGSPGVDGIWADPGVANVSLDGLQVAQSSGDGIKLQGPNCTVRNCWVHDSSNNGMSVRGQFSTFLERNLVENNGRGGTGNGLDVSGTNCFVRGNVVRNNQGWGMQVYEAPPFSSSGFQVYENLLYGNSFGLTIWSPAGQTNYVFNNTVVSTGNACLKFDYGTVFLTNNILSVASGSSPVSSIDGTIVVPDFNLYNVPNVPAGPHDLVAGNLGFVNPSAGLYWLSPASPALGAANSGIIPPVDFFGKGQTLVSDIGAFQYSPGQAADTRVLDPSGAQGADYWTPQISTDNPPIIVGQPQSVTISAGQSASFSVRAVGDAPLSYQWTFNGVPVGANSSSYSRANCTTDDDGGQVRVTVGNAFGSPKSAAASLSVNPAGIVYYVSPNGSDGNTGLSPSSPWTLKKGISNLGPDVTVVMLPGSYPGPVTVYQVAGAAGHPATLKSQVKWGAVVANSPGHGVGLGFTPYVSYFVLDGLCISNSTTGDGVGFTGHHNTVRNCWIVGNYMQGVNASNAGCSNNIIERNLIEGNGTIAASDPSNIHYHGIYLSGPNNIVRNNVIRNNCVGFGLQYYTSYSGMVQNNTVVYGNLIYGHTNAFGVTIWSAIDGGAAPGSNCLFGNTIADGVSLYYGSCGLTNNIILPSVGHPSLPVYVSSSSPASVQQDYNMSSFAFSGGTHNVVTNYLGLVNPDAGLYWLTTDSPARNAASPSIVPAVDFFGNVQPVAADLGAFQYNSALTGDARNLTAVSGVLNFWALP